MVMKVIFDLDPKGKKKNSQSRELRKDTPCRGTACAKALSYEGNKDDEFRVVCSYTGG